MSNWKNIMKVAYNVGYDRLLHFKYFLADLVKRISTNLDFDDTKQIILLFSNCITVFPLISAGPQINASL